MNFYILTLFPEMVMNGLSTSITGRAIESGKLHIEAINIRDYTQDKHNHVDDYPYGGGAGMVMQAQPVYDAYTALVEKLGRKPWVIYMTPQGRTFNQGIAQELSEKEDIVLLCGHYEGIDERVLEMIVDDYMSGLCSFVLVIDCSSRHSFMSLWFPESSTSGTFFPMNSGGLVYCGYSSRLLMTMMAMVLAFSFTGCGNKKADETTATTEAASEVKDEFIKFVGTDIPKMDTEEAEIMKKFNSYFAEGTAVDTDALLKDLTDNLLPNYKTFLDDVQAIEVKTDEVKALKDQYYDAMNAQYEAMQKVEAAVKDKNKDIQTEAQKLLSDAQSKYTAYNDAVYALAQKENVTLNGEIATTATSEAGSTTEANTEAIDPSEAMTDEVETTEAAQ